MSLRELDLIVVVVAFAIAGGLGLVALSRWARRRNREVNDSVWTPRTRNFSLARIYFGNLSKFEEDVARGLAWVIIVGVLAFVGYVLLVFLTR